MKKNFIGVLIFMICSVVFLFPTATGEELTFTREDMIFKSTELVEDTEIPLNTSIYTIKDKYSVGDTIEIYGQNYGAQYNVSYTYKLPDGTEFLPQEEVMTLYSEEIYIESEALEFEREETTYNWYDNIIQENIKITKINQDKLETDKNGDKYAPIYIKAKRYDSDDFSEQKFRLIVYKYNKVTGEAHQHIWNQEEFDYTTSGTSHNDVGYVKHYTNFSLPSGTKNSGEIVTVSGGFCSLMSAPNSSSFYIVTCECGEQKVYNANNNVSLGGVIERYPVSISFNGFTVRGYSGLTIDPNGNNVPGVVVTGDSWSFSGKIEKTSGVMIDANTNREYGTTSVTTKCPASHVSSNAGSQTRVYFTQGLDPNEWECKNYTTSETLEYSHIKTLAVRKSPSYDTYTIGSDINMIGSGCMLRVWTHVKLECQCETPGRSGVQSVKIDGKWVPLNTVIKPLQDRAKQLENEMRDNYNSQKFNEFVELQNKINNYKNSAVVIGGTKPQTNIHGTLEYDTDSQDQQLNFSISKTGIELSPDRNRGVGSISWGAKITGTTTNAELSDEGTLRGKINFATQGTTISYDGETGKKTAAYSCGHTASVPIDIVDPVKPELRVIINPMEGGNVTLNGNKIESGKPIKLNINDVCKLVATSNEGYILDKWILPDGTEVLNNEYEFNIVANTTILVNFYKGYTLYITSTRGGDAWTDGNEKHSSDSIISFTEGLPEGETMYIIEKVRPGEVFDINFDADVDYVLGSLEYRPENVKTSEIEVNKEGEYVVSGKTQITMPASDLTVTAIFKKDEVPPKGTAPTLKVTSNNVKWGNAYAMINGVPTEMTNKYDVVAFSKYDVYFEAVEGYYFTGWKYTTTESPFISGIIVTEGTEDALKKGQSLIKMPNKNLEIMAMFSPVPKKLGHSVDFKAEPEEGGSVPSDLNNVEPGTKIILEAVPNPGYILGSWTFKDSEGNIIDIEIKVDEDGTKYIIMPDFDITIIAGFVQKGKAYTLYITSTTGGNAWTDGNENHSKDSIIHFTDGLPEGETMYIIKDVYAGEKFDIEFLTELGYTFSNLEYRPRDVENQEVYINESNKKVTDGKIQITMPESDLTVTAIFKKDEKPSEGKNPTIKVTSNNVKWGSAYAKLEKVKTEMSKEYEATAFTKYEVYFEAETGYYFTGWKYTTTESPFVSGIVKTKGEDGAFEEGHATIKMPNRNLEIMAMFSPIPEDVGNKVDFKVEPEDAAEAPDDLENVEPGTKVELVPPTPNPGYIFEGWIFKDEDGNVIDIEIKKDEDGTEYFIMPDKNIIVIAKFGDANGKYKLYVTSMVGGDAWTYGNENHSRDSIIKVTEGLLSGKIMHIVENVEAGEKFNISFIADPGYTFVNLDYRPKNVETEIIDMQTMGEFISTGTIEVTMPASDLIVTAIFKKDEVPAEGTNPTIKVTSNNINWGSAYAMINDVPTDMDKVYEAIAGNNYTTYFVAKPGYYFTGWRYSTFDSPFIGGVTPTLKVDGGFVEGNSLIEMPNKNLEIMAMFSPIPEQVGNSVDFESSPSGAGVVPEDLENVEPGSKVITYVTPNDGYKFIEWIFKDETPEKDIQKDGTGHFIMPDNDIKAIAKFNDKSEPGWNTNPNPYPNPNPVGPTYSYNLTIQVVGSGSVDVAPSDLKKISSTTYKVPEGEYIGITAHPSNEYNCKTITDSYTGQVIGNSDYYSFYMPAADVVIQVVFEKEVSNFDGGVFKIISVRDLRWKDYFTQPGAERNNYFEIPITNKVMLNSGNEDMDKVKLGYAVEFELLTTVIKRDDINIKIIPAVYYKGSKVDWRDIEVYDVITGRPTGKNLGAAEYDYLREINISASDLSSKIMASKVVTNGLGAAYKDYETTWRWVYYLPGDLRLSDKYGVNRRDATEHITIRLESIVEQNTKSSSSTKYDLIKMMQSKRGSSWNGDVFKYYLNKTLYDDIYNNATN